MIRIPLILTLLALLPASAIAQNTWTVDPSGGGHFLKIQDALSDASVINGDTVIVTIGNYSENIDFLGKAIHLKSAFGPTLTTINGRGLGPVVVFENNESLDSILEGFTLTNGVGRSISSKLRGGGIYSADASPTITGNFIFNCSAWEGSGIYLSNFAGVVDSNEIMANSGNNTSVSPHDARGGGIYARGGDPKITNNTLNGNYAHFGAGMFLTIPTGTITGNICLQNIADFPGSGGKGGGVYLENNGPIIFRDNQFIDNFAIDAGGGAYLDTHESVIEDCTFSGNSTGGGPGHGGGEGGGLYFQDYGAPYILRNNLIESNNARDGGGIYTSEWVQIAITGNTIINNIAEWGALGADFGGGGGVGIFNMQSAIIEGNTISGNYCDGNGGGIYVYGNSSGPTILNNIIQNNEATVDAGGIALCSNDPSNPRPTLFNNLIADNVAGRRGGGILCESSAPTIVGNTIAGNSAATLGSGIYTRLMPTLPLMVVDDSIVWGNTGTPNQIVALSTCDFQYSCLQDSDQEPWFGNGCLSVDPIFTSAAAGDYFLSQALGGQSTDSPCLDLANPNSVVDGTTCTQGYKDTGTVDVGFHYAVFAPDFDVDDDGLLDEDEINIYGTDPFVFDTDGDGLGDGQELGMTNSTVTLSTDLSVFKEDHDPSTTTNPLAYDTDQGGISDGHEDQDKNGAFNTYETDPNSDADDHCALYVYDFAIGNKVVFRVRNGYPNAAVIPCYSLAGTGPTDVGYGLLMDLTVPIKQLAPILLTGGGYGEAISQRIPNDPNLIGLPVYVQGVEVAVRPGQSFRLTNSITKSITEEP